MIETTGKYHDNVIWNLWQVIIMDRAMSKASDSILPYLAISDSTCALQLVQLSAQLTWQSCPRKEQNRASPVNRRDLGLGGLGSVWIRTSLP